MVGDYGDGGQSVACPEILFRGTVANIALQKKKPLDNYKINICKWFGI